MLRPGDSVGWKGFKDTNGIITKVDDSIIKVWWFDLNTSYEYTHKEALLTKKG